MAEEALDQVCFSELEAPEVLRRQVIKAGASCYLGFLHGPGTVSSQLVVWWPQIFDKEFVFPQRCTHTSSSHSLALTLGLITQTRLFPHGLYTWIGLPFMALHTNNLSPHGPVYIQTYLPLMALYTDRPVPSWPCVHIDRPASHGLVQTGLSSHSPVYTSACPLMALHTDRPVSTGPGL